MQTRSLACLILLLAALFLAACQPSGPLAVAPDATATALMLRQQAADRTQAAQQTAIAATANAPTATPTVTPTATATATPTNTPTPTASPTPDYSAKFHSARILFYEDLVFSRTGFAIPSPARDALDNSGYTYTYLKDRPGSLLKALTAESWDLVIISAERSNTVNIDFYPPLWQHLQSGGALIWETWHVPTSYGNPTYGLPASFFWGNCGIAQQDNYTSDMERQIFFPNPGARLLQTPNRIESLGESTLNWGGDIGELFSSAYAARAQVIARISNDEDTNNDAVLTTCYDGRMILQSFSTHDYAHEPMTALWENYIYNALDAFYRSQETSDPLPARKAELKILNFRSSTPTGFLGYPAVSAGSAAELEQNLSAQTWDIILFADVAIWTPTERAAYLALLPAIQAQLEQGASVWLDLSAAATADDAQELSPAYDGLFAACGVELSEPPRMLGETAWFTPDHPIANWPAAFTNTHFYTYRKDGIPLLQKTAGSQALLLAGFQSDAGSPGEASSPGEAGADPQRGSLALCHDNRLILQVLPIGYSLLAQNILDYLARQRLGLPEK